MVGVTVVATSAPYIHASGTTDEVLAHLKAQNVPASEVIAIWFNNTDTSCVYRR